MTDQAKRLAVHEAVDRMLDAEELIAKTSDPNERERIAWSRRDDYRLNLRFPHLEKYIMAINAPEGVNTEDADIDVETKREMYAGAIHWGIPLPQRDASELYSGLHALNFGQTMKIFEPTKNSTRINSHQIHELQLFALMGSYFLHGTGITKEKSRTIVAGYYGEATGENIRTWEKRLIIKSGGDWKARKVLMCQMAQFSGKLFSSGDPQPPGSTVVFVTMENALQSMEACGKAYRAALDKEEIDIPKIYFNYLKSGGDHESPPAGSIGAN